MASFAYERLSALLGASGLPQEKQANVLALLQSSETGLAFLDDAVGFLSSRSKPRDQQSPTWEQEILSMVDKPDPVGAAFRAARDVMDRIRPARSMLSDALLLHTAIAQAPSNTNLTNVSSQLLSTNQLMIGTIESIRELPLNDIRATLEGIRMDENRDLETRIAAGHARQLVDAVRGSFGESTLRALKTSVDNAT